MRRLVRVVGQSMTPTFRSSDLLVTRLPGPAGLRRGDAAVLHHGGLRMIKRVVGMPGDLVELEAGRLRVNGVPVDGQRRVAGAYTQTWRVPARHYFVAGDNPAASDDSRVWDEPFVPVASVEALVTRRLGLPRRIARGTEIPRGATDDLRPRRPVAAADRAA